MQDKIAKLISEIQEMNAREVQKARDGLSVSDVDVFTKKIIMQELDNREVVLKMESLDEE